MILVLQKDLSDSAIAHVSARLRELGVSAQLSQSACQKLFVVTDDTRDMPTHLFSRITGVEKVVRVQSRYPLTAGVDYQGVRCGTVTIGGGNRPVLAAGPCSVEGRAQTLSLAKSVSAAGASMLRGGAFKPRTSPYDFAGLGLDALKYLHESGQAHKLPVVSEVMSVEQIELSAPYVDMFQVGARNMYNYELLREIGRSGHPVLLKRAMSATISEFLQAAEYILLQGNTQVVLCERGIRTFETHTRNTLDLSAVAAIKSMTNLPVLVDPSHGTGRPELIRPMSRAAIACGADGLLIEVHGEPSMAYSDGSQAITPSQLADIAKDMHVLYQALFEIREPHFSVHAPALAGTSSASIK